MEVIVSTETGIAMVTLFHDDYDQVSQMFENISLLQGGANDPLLDAIREHLPEGFDIDEENSLWTTSNEEENSIDLSFRISKDIYEMKMEEKLHLSLFELKSLYLEAKKRGIEELEVDTAEREEDCYDALDFGDYLHHIHQIKIIE